MDIKKIRKKFPMLKQDIVYLDNAALLQKPIEVINAGTNFYKNFCISNRTNISKIGQIVEDKILLVRKKIANLIDANFKNVVFTSGTTESLNLLAKMLLKIIKKNDEILVSKFNHSSNIVPWIEIAKQKKCKIKFVFDIEKNINEKTKLVIISQKSNSFFYNYKIEKIYKKCKNFSNCFLINDAAQSISYENSSLNFCDAIAFSANKMYGPTGLGILALSDVLAKKSYPAKYGGGAVAKIYEEEKTWIPKDLFYVKNEPGTLNIAAIFQLEKAINFIEKIGYKKIQSHIKKLAFFFDEEIKKIKNFKNLSPGNTSIKIIINKKIDSHVVNSNLGSKNIYVRSGIFCNKILENRKPYNEIYLRISFAIYNSKNDIEKLMQILKEEKQFEYL